MSLVDTRNRRSGVRAPAATRRSGVRPLAAWTLVAVLVAAITLSLAGCGDRVPEIAEGCVLDDAVAPEVRRSVEKAAATFLDQVRQGEWSSVWEGTAGQVRQASSEQEFLDSIRRVTSTIGIPPEVETVSIAVVGFGESYPHRSKLDVPVEGKDYPLSLLLPSHPVLASLVQRSAAAPEAFYYCTLWFLEEGQWHLATFFAKPATSYGHDWEFYSDLAGEQRLAGNIRNAGILYNLAIDLVVPAAWIKPPEVDRLEKMQKRINADRLPVGRISRWPAPPDTFQVFLVQYNLLPSGAGLMMSYESPVPVNDTPGQVEYAGRLFRYVEEEFPEYPEVFASVTLQAYDPATRTPFWIRTYPLEATP